MNSPILSEVVKRRKERAYSAPGSLWARLSVKVGFWIIFEVKTTQKTQKIENSEKIPEGFCELIT